MERDEAEVIASRLGGSARTRRLPWCGPAHPASVTLRAPKVSSEQMRIADLQPGWDVVTNDGHRLGRVKDVGQHFVEVAGGLFSSSLYVPSSAIGNVERETVHLNLAHGQIDATGWQQPPRLPDDLQTAAEPERDRDI
jgi:hypothetical protein